MAFEAPHIITVLVTLAIIILSVVVHYEGLSALSRWLGLELFVPRAKIAALIFGQLILHVLEIWIFAAGYFILSEKLKFGALLQLSYVDVQPSQAIGFIDYVYYSAVVYSTLGFGDLVPSGMTIVCCR